MGGQTMQAVVAFEGVVGKSVQESVKKLNSSIGGVSKKSLAVTAAMVAGFASVATAAFKAGQKIFALASEFEDAYKTIRVGTGATGDALQGLKDDFKSVYSTVPASMSDTSQAIADLNTRLGLSGPVLQEVSKQALLLSGSLGAGNLTGIIEKSSQAFSAWNIPADQMAEKMDFIFKASQSTGMSFENLAQYAQQNADTFKSLGYDFETTVTLIGQMEKSGLNVNDVFAGMKKSIQEISKTGKNANQVFKNYYSQIMKATSETEAINIASEIFGTKNAPTMVKAIRSGQIDVAKLATELHNSTENIQDLAWETMSLGDKFKMLGNKAEVALEPVAMSLLDFINEMMPAIQEIAKQAVPTFKAIVEHVKQIWQGGVEVADMFKRNWGVIGPIVVGLMSALVAYKTIVMAIAAYHKIAAVAQGIYTTAMGICTGATTVATVATTAFGGALAFVTSPIFLAALAIGALVAAGYMLYKNWDEVCEGAQILGEQIAEVWTSIKNWVVDTVTAIWDKVTGVFKSVVNFVKTNWKTMILGALNPIGLIAPFVAKAMKTVLNKFNVIQKAKKIFASVWSSITSGVSGFTGSLWSKVTGVFGRIVEFFKANWKTVIMGVLNPMSVIIPYVGKLVSGILDKFGIGDKVREIFAGIVETIKDVWSGIASFLTTPFNVAFSALESFAPGVAQFVANLGTSIVDGFKAAFDLLVGLVTNPIDTIKTIVGGIADTATNVWNLITTGCTTMASGISQTFTNVFSGLVGIISTPIRTVIGLMNKAIDGINSISVSFPSWVPGVGGKKFGVNIPHIPTFATGGFTNGVSIAGEAGTEAIISFNQAYRTENLGYLAKAASMLGVGANDYATETFLSGLTGSELMTNSTTNNSTSVNITYAPTVTMTAGDGITESGITAILRKHANDLADQVQEILNDRKGGNYGDPIY